MLEERQQIEAQRKNYFDYHQYPRLEQWLNVVGIASSGVKVGYNLSFRNIGKGGGAVYGTAYTRR